MSALLSGEGESLGTFAADMKLLVQRGYDLHSRKPPQ